MPRKTWGTKRFVRVHNNSLWQADFKLCDNDWWMISYQDGHSRFATGSVKVWNLTGGNAMLLLGSVVRRYGALRQILTGQGTWFKLARGETSGVGLRCGEFGVVHVCASVRGRLRVASLKFSTKLIKQSRTASKGTGVSYGYYNYTRLREGIGYLIPAEIYLN